VRGEHGIRRDETGDATVDFVLIGALLTVLTLAVIQLGLALLIRNTVLDAAAEGARYAALADNSLPDGAERTRDLITAAIGSGYATDIRASYQDRFGIPAVTVTVRAPLPLIGLVGISHGMEVQAHAAVEALD
jgi:Flp pilus assembly protein TadG